MEKKSEKLEEAKSERNSEISVKSAQQIESKQLIKSLFLGSNRMVEGNNQ
jgi:hypothetical protein